MTSLAVGRFQLHHNLTDCHTRCPSLPDSSLLMRCCGSLWDDQHWCLYPLARMHRKVLPDKGGRASTPRHGGARPSLSTSLIEGWRRETWSCSSGQPGGRCTGAGRGWGSHALSRHPPSPDPRVHAPASSPKDRPASSRVFMAVALQNHDWLRKWPLVIDSTSKPSPLLAGQGGTELSNPLTTRSVLLATRSHPS